MSLPFLLPLYFIINNLMMYPINKEIIMIEKYFS